MGFIGVSLSTKGKNFVAAEWMTVVLFCGTTDGEVSSIISWAFPGKFGQTLCRS